MTEDNVREIGKLAKLEFRVIKLADPVIQVSFFCDALSEALMSFLQDQGFEFHIIPETGRIEGFWLTGPFPESEYRDLQRLFLSYGVLLPDFGKV